MRAMIRSIYKRMPTASFTVVAQLRDRHLKIPFRNIEVELRNMLMGAGELLRLAIYSVFKFVRLDLDFILGREGKAIVRAYRESQIVISAPGGPYFGDIYWHHEALHWLFVWLGRLHKKRILLYSPSVGPFNIWILRVIRRYLFKFFAVLCVREKISKSHLNDLLGKRQVHVTADSAFQESITPDDRSDFLNSRNLADADPFLVAVSVIDYKFPGDSDPDIKREAYRQTLLAALNRIAARRAAYFIFLPQLYGRYHSDRSYLETVAESLPDNTGFEIIKSDVDSDGQRAIIGMCDFCIASRYHPQIFALSSQVPGICFYYEHKTLGIMNMFGLERFAFDIRRCDPDTVSRAIDEILADPAKVTATIEHMLPTVQHKAGISTDLVIATMDSECHRGGK
jgi:polysaccharide pyruvyl transferase WcaK-like protein